MKSKKGEGFSTLATNTNWKALNNMKDIITDKSNSDATFLGIIAVTHQNVGLLAPILVPKS